jgi:hypothetical protein
MPNGEAAKPIVMVSGDEDVADPLGRGDAAKVI